MQNFEHFELDGGKDSSTAAKMQLHADAVTDDVKDKDQDRSIKYQIVDDILSEKVIKRIVSWKSVVMYGLCLSLVGHYVGWTVSLNAGFWEVFGTMFILLTSTGCLMLCIAEMTAALPFSGGTYGVVRVTLGDLLGYLVGTCEVLQNVLYVAFTVGALAKYLTIMTGYDNRFEPLYWVVFYLTIGIITSNHRTLFPRSPAELRLQQHLQYFHGASGDVHDALLLSGLHIRIHAADGSAVEVRVSVEFAQVGLCPGQVRQCGESAGGQRHRLPAELTDLLLALWHSYLCRDAFLAAGLLHQPGGVRDLHRLPQQVPLINEEVLQSFGRARCSVWAAGVHSCVGLHRRTEQCRDSLGTIFAACMFSYDLVAAVLPVLPLPPHLL